MSKRLVVTASLMGVGMVMAPLAEAVARCGEHGSTQTVVEASIGAGPGAIAVVLRLLPGGIAEYEAHGTCTMLTFTGMRDGSAVYTDDGLGRGLTVAVSKERQLVVSHAAGWTARSP